MTCSRIILQTRSVTGGDFSCKRQLETPLRCKLQEKIASCDIVLSWLFTEVHIKENRPNHKLTVVLHNRWTATTIKTWSSRFSLFFSGVYLMIKKVHRSEISSIYISPTRVSAIVHCRIRTCSWWARLAGRAQFRRTWPQKKLRGPACKSDDTETPF